MANPKSQFNTEDRFNEHVHNGSDSKKIPFDNIKITKEAAISDPSGGMTVDVEGRSATNAIIDVLEAHGLIET